MGSGKMGKWNIDNIPLDNVVKSIHKKRNSVINQYSTIPSFHYSMCEAKSPSLNKCT